MEFKVSSGDLLKHLNVVAGAIHTNPILAITEDFLVDIRKGTMTLTATNLETSISTRMQVESKEDGAVAIPAKILLETLKAFQINRYHLISIRNNAHLCSPPKMVCTRWPSIHRMIFLHCLLLMIKKS